MYNFISDALFLRNPFQLFQYHTTCFLVVFQHQEQLYISGSMLQKIEAQPHCFAGKDMGPSYTNKDQYCSSDGQCSTSVGEICWWFYDGCTHGRCMCDPRSHFLDSSGKCRKGNISILTQYFCRTTKLCTV